MERSNINFGVESYCFIKFIGPEDSNLQYHWFANHNVPLKNGNNLSQLIGNGKRIHDLEGLESYYEMTYGESTYYFDDELNVNTYHFNKHSLSEHFKDINDIDGQYLFLIDAGDYGNMSQIRLSESILNDVNDGKCIILFNTSYEPYSNEKKDFIIILERFVEKYKLTKDTLKIITGNLIVENQPNKNYEFIPYCYFLEHPWFIRKEALMGEKYPTHHNEDLKKEINSDFERFINHNRTITKFDKPILCYQRRAHPHRRYLFYRLFMNKFVYDNTYASLNGRDQKFQVDYSKQFGTTFEESVEINRFYFDNEIQEWGFDGNDLNINLATDFDESVMKNTFVSLISETTTINEVIFFSEKIFKPIYACQPFILVSSKNSLKKLKELGFKTFDRWWDEGYDEKETLKERIDEIEKILVDLCSKSDEELCKILNEMEEVLIHNFNHFITANNENFYEVFEKINYTNSWSRKKNLI